MGMKLIRFLHMLLAWFDGVQSWIEFLSRRINFSFSTAERHEDLVLYTLQSDGVLRVSGKDSILIFR